MKKNYLVFIPTGLNSPELELLIAHTQEMIDKKHNVTILSCKGGKNYKCSKNLYSIPSLCNLCIKKRKNIINKISGQFNYIETPEIEKPLYQKKFNDFKKLKKYKYKSLDNGLASYSSYLDITRDKDLKGFFATKLISKLVHTTDILSNFYDNFLSKNKFHELIIFNGRMNLYRPLFRLAEKYKIRLNNLETTHDGKNLLIHNLKSSLVNDYDKLPKLIEKHWYKKLKINKKKIIDKFYSDVKKFNSYQENPVSFLWRQKKDLLPEVWNKNKYNLAYFVSSEDEYESIVKKKDDSVFKNQLDSIIEICRIIENREDFSLYVRMHPNLSNVKWSFVTDILKLKDKFKNLVIIPPTSSVSTHALMSNANLVLGLRSRALLESIYIKKPTILLGNSYWESLGPFLKIRSKKNLKKLILSKKPKYLGSLAAKKYAFFWLTQGKTHKYVKGNYLWKKDKSSVSIDFKFKTFSSHFSSLDKLFYYLCKILERTMTKINYKLSK